MLWDLREPEALHRRVGAAAGGAGRGGGGEPADEGDEPPSALRRPSCTRGNLGEALASHRAPLVALRSLDQLLPECVVSVYCMNCKSSIIVGQPSPTLLPTCSIYIL